jgi:hypothetical protein
MNNRRLPTSLISLLFFLTGLLSGCASFITPEIGMVARPEARIPLVGEGGDSGIWSTKDLRLEYRLTVTADSLAISGPLTLSPSISNSFPVVQKFFLRLSFLDGEGRVVGSTDITPLYSSHSTMESTVTVNARRPRPAGSQAIAFNYFGVFRGQLDSMGGDEWPISSFPFD